MHLSLSFNHNYGKSHIFSPSPYVYVPVDSDHISGRTSITSDFDYLVWNLINPSLGFQYIHESYELIDFINEERNLDNVKRNFGRVYCQAPIQQRFFGLVDAKISTGLSLDFLDEEIVLSPPQLQIEGGLSYQCPIIMGGFSTGFRQSTNPPSFTDLYWHRDAFSEGNSDLFHEKSESQHIRLFSAFDRDFVSVHCSIDFWARETDSVIVWNRGFDGIYRPMNMGKELANGQDHLFEIELFEILRFKWSNSLITSENKSKDRYLNGKTLPFIPSYLEKWDLSLNHFGLELAVSATNTGKKFTLPANTKWTDSYNILDSRISWLLPFKKFRISSSFLVKNITDICYETMPGYPAIGRNYQIILTVQKGER